MRSGRLRRARAPISLRSMRRALRTISTGAILSVSPKESRGRCRPASKSSNETGTSAYGVVGASNRADRGRRLWLGSAKAMQLGEIRANDLQFDVFVAADDLSRFCDSCERIVAPPQVAVQA